MMLADRLASITLTLISAIIHYPPAPTSDNKTFFFTHFCYYPGLHLLTFSPYGLTIIQLLNSWVTCLLLTSISVHLCWGLRLKY